MYTILYFVKYNVSVECLPCYKDYHISIFLYFIVYILYCIYIILGITVYIILHILQSSNVMILIYSIPLPHSILLLMMLTIMNDDAHDYVCKMLKLRLYDKLFIRVRIEHSKLNVFKNCQNMTFLLLDYSAPKKKSYNNDFIWSERISYHSFFISFILM